MLADHLQKTTKTIQKFKETGDSRYIYQNKLDKACFEHNMAYGYFKNLARKTASNKIFEILRISGRSCFKES